MNGEIPISTPIEAAKVIPLEYAPPPAGPHPWWRVVASWAVALGWACCAVGWLLIVAVDTESVMVTGPILLLLGITSAIAGRRLNAVWPIIIGISHCAICVVFVSMVSVWRLGPRSSYVPFTIVGALYTIAIAFPTYFALFWPTLDLRKFIPGLREGDFVQDLAEPLRLILGYELMHGNVVVRVERLPWSRSPLAVVLKNPLRLDSADRDLKLPVTIRRWENRDPRSEPQAGWACSITLHALVGPIPPHEL